MRSHDLLALVDDVRYDLALGRVPDVGALLAALEWAADEITDLSADLSAEKDYAKGLDERLHALTVACEDAAGLKTVPLIRQALWEAAQAAA